MTEKSNYLENALVDHITGNSTFTAPTLYVALYTSDPTDADIGTECHGGAYAREVITFDAAVSGEAQNNTVVRFATATGSWGTITHIALRDAVTGGNLLYHSPLNDSVAPGSGDVVEIPVGAVRIIES